MDEKTKKLLEKLKGKKVGVFIDDANLFYAKKKVGWQIDFTKLRYLLEQTMEIICFRYHIAMPATWDAAYKTSRNYLDKIKETAEIKSKPLKYIRSDGVLIKKGDVDLEIAVDVMRNLKKIDCVIIVSGDSDYIELRNFILEQKKQIIFLAFKENMAWEIKTGKYIFLNKVREHIELKQ